MPENVAETLIAAARPYWDAEAALAKAFFENRPDKPAWERFLRAAVYKELNPVIGYGSTDGYANGLHMEFSDLVEKFNALDRSVARRDLLARLEMMTEEFEHYVVLAEVLERLLGRPLTPEDAVQLPEDRKLNDMRRRYMESGDPCLRAAMELTEGGGSSAFREASKLSGGEIEDHLASAMALIHKDEENHYLDAAAAAASAAKTDDDIERMKEVLIEVSRQRVEMRYEMFSEPMSRERLEALIADGTAPA